MIGRAIARGDVLDGRVLVERLQPGGLLVQEARDRVLGGRAAERAERAEVVADAGDVRLGRGGDVAQRHAVLAALGEQRERGVEQALLGARAGVATPVGDALLSHPLVY